LQFLEQFLSHKTGKKIEETNITRWRRAVCGDLTAAFQEATDGKSDSLSFLNRDAFVEEIDRAQFKELPTGFRALTKDEAEQIHRNLAGSALLPKQEPGLRRSSPLPYELAVDGSLNKKRTQFTIRFEAKKVQFGDRAAGSPFIVYARPAKDGLAVRHYAVEAGEFLEDSWAIKEFEKGLYHLRVYGPNGFFREFLGGTDDPDVGVHFDYARVKPGEQALTGAVNIIAVNCDVERSSKMEVRDRAYRSTDQSREVPPGGRETLIIDTQKSFGWYDFSVRISVQERFFEKRYAGRVETGNWSWSDPYMGRVVK
jgi:phospholipase C